MANNTSIIKSKNSSQVWQSTLNALKKRHTNELKKRLWQCTAAPTVDQGSQATYPIALGDFIYDYGNSAPYVCTVAPAASTAGTFVKLIA